MRRAKPPPPKVAMARTRELFETSLHGFSFLNNNKVDLFKYIDKIITGQERINHEHESYCLGFASGKIKASRKNCITNVIR